MRRRRGEIRRAVTAAPRAISFPSCGKRYGRKGRWRREIALSRRKNLSLRCACCRYAVRSPNALRAAAQLGFPSARYTVRVVLFAPVEYLTYGKRKAVTQQALPCISRTNKLPFKSQPKQPQSISMTSPVYPIRICSAVCWFEITPAQTKPRGKSKEGGRSPLLGRFKGDCQGGESKLPLDYAFFRPSTALSFSYEKESGVENAPAEAFRSTNMARGTLCRQRTLSPVRLQVVHPVIFASANCPSRQSGPLMRTSRPPSVRAVSSSPSLPSTSTRIVLPT